MNGSRENYSLMIAQLQHKCQDFAHQGVPADKIQIVLGEYTDKVFVREITMQPHGWFFDIATGRRVAQLKKVQTMHGSELWGTPVVVDTATPHLWTVRKKQCAK